MYTYRSRFLTRYAQLAPCALEDIEALEQLRILHHGYRIKGMRREFSGRIASTLVASG